MYTGTSILASLILHRATKYLQPKGAKAPFGQAKDFDALLTLISKFAIVWGLHRVWMPLEWSFELKPVGG